MMDNVIVLVENSFGCLGHGSIDKFFLGSFGGNNPMNTINFTLNFKFSGVVNL